MYISIVKAHRKFVKIGAMALKSAENLSDANTKRSAQKYEKQAFYAKRAKNTANIFSLLRI